MNIASSVPRPPKGNTGAAQRTPPSPDDASLWTAFAESRTTAELLAAWLALQCANIGGVRAATLLLSRSDGSFGPAAVWPDRQTDIGHLAAVAERALSQRIGINVPAADEQDRFHIAYPIASEDDIHGAIVVDAAAKPGADLQRILRRLHWGAGWVEALVWRNRSEEMKVRLDAAATSLEMLAVVEEHDSVDGAILALVNELGQRFQCERVSFGFAHDERIKLQAMSNAAWFQKKADLVGAIENAMEEALDQASAVVVPPLPSTANRIAIAHRDLMQAWKAASVMSVVVRSRADPVGVITFERTSDAPFDPAQLEIAELVGSLLGPALKAKSDLHRVVAGRAAAVVKKSVQALIGPKHPAAKLGAVALVLAIATAAVLTGEFRITAKSVLEGSVQRAAVAPFQGFIQQAPAKAGDVVRADQLLAVLDDRDLRSDVLKWESERQKNLQRERDAHAKHDRTGSLVAAAQSRQAEAELALATDKLSRTRIVAPIDGLVVSGDLSQLIGSPVEQGKVLFEIAPLNSYRVVIQVGEFDIRYVTLHQKGQLSLTGAAGVSVPIEVERITPVSTAQNGRNAFRVEGLLGGADVPLRPGMEGVAKLTVGRASLLWIWTRPVIERLRVFMWEWMP